MFGGTSTGVSGATQSSSPFSTMPAFGASSSSSFVTSTTAFGASSTPASGSSSSGFGGSYLFGRKPAFGESGSNTQTNPFGSTSQPTQSAFGSRVFVSSPTLGASSQSAFSCTNISALGSTNTPLFGTTTPTFGTTSTPAFDSTATPPFGSRGTAIGSSTALGFSTGRAFGTSGAQAPTPTFGSSDFGRSPCGGQRGGSRVAPYKPTMEADSGSETQQAGKLESLLAMFEYINKSHEELRWEDYQSGDKGGQNPAGQSTSTVGFGAPPSTPPAFGQSYPFASTVTSNPFGASCTPAFGAPSIPTSGASSIPIFGPSAPAFNALSTPAFGASSLPAFGAYSCPSFSFGSSPVFGQSLSRFGTSPCGPRSSPFENQIGAQATTPHWKIWSFHIIRHARALATIPTSGSSGFGKSPFGGQRGGSRMIPYTPTPEADSGSGIQPANKLESLSAMPAYMDKSHEELKWEDYQCGDRGEPNPAGQSAGAVDFGVALSIPSPSFGQSHYLPPPPPQLHLVLQVLQL